MTHQVQLTILRVAGLGTITVAAAVLAIDVIANARASRAAWVGLIVLGVILGNLAWVIERARERQNRSAR